MFKSFTPKKTVASVMASFHKTIADLSEVEATQDAEAEYQIEIARVANQTASAALKEKQAAADVRKKLEALVNA